MHPTTTPIYLPPVKAEPVYQEPRKLSYVEPKPSYAPEPVYHEPVLSEPKLPIIRDLPKKIVNLKPQYAPIPEPYAPVIPKSSYEEPEEYVSYRNMVEIQLTM